MLDSANLPKWLKPLLSESFFSLCIIHKNIKKNEKNIFCLDCCVSICAHCLSDHPFHCLLQIRRYIYNDVLRVIDAEKLIDCSYVQSYTNNKAKVLFIKKRPQTRPCRVFPNICITCDKGLPNHYLYCCLSCKVEHILATEGKLTKNHVFEFEGQSFPEPLLDDGLMTPDSVLEPARSNGTGSLSGSKGNICVQACTATSVGIVRKKRTLHRAACQPMVLPAAEITAGRRKSMPHRAPLY